MALGLILVAGLTYLVLKRHHENSVAAARDPSGPVATATTRTRLSPAHAHHRHRRQAAGANPSDVLGLPPGTVPQGLNASGRTGSGDPHRLTVTISGADPLGHVYYIIPTSAQYRRGSAAVSSTSWALHTTVWGSPKYAVAGVQANYLGTPVSCTITVDGHVTDHRTSRGPFSVIWCVG